MSDSTPNRWWLVIAAGLGVFMAQLDATIVQVALPVMRDELNASAGVAQWIVLAYMLPPVALVLPAGRWIREVGQRPALWVAVGGFILSSVAVACSTSIAAVIVTRVLQGGFGAALFVLLPVLATTAVAPRARGRAMGLVMTLGPLGAFSGPAVGGVLIDTLGWPTIFLINVPLGIAIILIGHSQLAPGGVLRSPATGWLTDTTTLGVSTVAIMLALSLSLTHPGWLCLVAVAGPLLYVWWRQSTSQDVRELLRLPRMAAPFLALWGQASAIVAAQFLISFFMQDTLGMSATSVGLALLGMSGAMIACGPLGGWLSDSWGARNTAVAGAAVYAVGFVALIPMSIQWTSLDILWRLMIVGAGTGLFAGANTTTVMSAVPPHLLPTGSAVISMARHLGIASGPALATILWGLSGYRGWGMSLAMAGAALAAVLSVVASVRSRDRHTAEAVKTGTR